MIMKREELQRIAEIDTILDELRKQDVNEQTEEREGLGDVVESTLNRFGITEERFKDWFNLESCKCDARKKFLNKVKLWRK
jgi:hypothetical protein|tara:strand:+ start:1626 stop:1868 length:243 start_codon:yes stop_codon:yes gene_type:complete